MICRFPSFFLFPSGGTLIGRAGRALTNYLSEFVIGNREFTLLKRWRSVYQYIVLPLKNTPTKNKEPAIQSGFLLLSQTPAGEFRS